MMIDPSKYHWAIERLQRAFGGSNVVLQERDCGFALGVAVKYHTPSGVMKRCGLELFARHCCHPYELNEEGQVMTSCEGQFHEVHDLNEHPERLDQFIASCDQEFAHA